jgi:hypothetical protein
MSRYTIAPTPPNLKPRTAAYDASDVTRRNWGKTVVFYKTQNEFDKQNGLTVRGVQNGIPGAQPVSFSLIPYLYEASQSQLYTVQQFTQIVAGIQADYDRKYRVRNTTDFAPTGAVGGIFSVPHIVQGIDFNSNGDRIVLSYDFTNMVYHIYKIPYDDPSGVPVIDSSGEEFLMKYASQNPYNTFVTIMPFTANDTFTGFYIAGYTSYPFPPVLNVTQGFPYIRRFGEELNIVESKRIYDAIGNKLTNGSFAFILSLNGYLYATGFAAATGDFTIDGITWPYCPGNTPFICKLDYNMNLQWVTRIKPGTSNSCASVCAALSNGDLIAPITVDQGGAWGPGSGQSWSIQTGGATPTTFDKLANTLIARLDTTTGQVTNYIELLPVAINYIGGARGLQVFVDNNDNIFLSITGQYNDIPYTPTPPYPFIPQTYNFGNGVSTTVNSSCICLIIKYNSNLVAQAVFNMDMPPVLSGQYIYPYQFYNKFISFDPAGNLNINASYTTSNYANITVNTMVLPNTNGDLYNTVSYSVSNDLSTVNWYNVIEGIRTDEAIPAYIYYRNGGILKVDTLNQQLIKVDERANIGQITAAPGATLPAVSGDNKSFLIYYN